MSTLTAGATVITPDIITVESYTQRIEHRPIVHDILGGDQAHTLRTPTPETGTLVAVFRGETAEQRIVDFITATATPGVLNLDDTIRPYRSMQFILDGYVEATMAVPGKAWTLRIPYKKVDA